jgi:16S rRNA (cytosine967-C5)-methyltransferase
VSARRLARDALVRVEDGAYSHVLLPQLLRSSGLSDRDRAFATDLVYGTLRAQRRLDERIDAHGRRPMDSLDPPVRAALRMGAYQLERGISEHAAVGETVGLVRLEARGYVNAVLRAVAAARPWPEPASDAVALSYPDWIVDRLRADLGDADARAALEASNAVPAVALRPNPLRTDGTALRAELAEAGIEVEPGAFVPDAAVTKGMGDPAVLASIAEGRATPQDQASQAITAYVDARPGERVLDVAAAPGGKATALAERVGPTGSVVALDVHAGRLGLVRTAAGRLGLANVAVTVADGRALPVSRASVDRALVDAPCTGLGVLRRRPEARWRIEESSIAVLAALQLELVLEAAAAVRPGGTLVYSVCTLTQAETRGVAAAVVAKLDGFEVLAPPVAPWRPWGDGALLLPQDAGTDGMFVLGLRRSDKPRLPAREKPKLPATEN